MLDVTDLDLSGSICTCTISSNPQLTALRWISFAQKVSMISISPNSSRDSLMTLSCSSWGRGAPSAAALWPLVEGHTSVLVGQSGVGKSSLIRALLPDLDIQTGALSRVTGKGTHTTTTTMLYQLPGGGRLMDSPGVWEYGLWKLDDAALAGGFPEFGAYAGQCRFNNCRHLSEPGCAIKAAAESGDIRSWRYQSYQRLMEQNDS